MPGGFPQNKKIMEGGYLCEKMTTSRAGGILPFRYLPASGSRAGFRQPVQDGSGPLPGAAFPGARDEYGCRSAVPV